MASSIYIYSLQHALKAFLLTGWLNQQRLCNGRNSFLLITSAFKISADCRGSSISTSGRTAGIRYYTSEYNVKIPTFCGRCSPIRWSYHRRWLVLTRSPDIPHIAICKDKTSSPPVKKENKKFACKRTFVWVVWKVFTPVRNRVHLTANRERSFKADHRVVVWSTLVCFCIYINPNKPHDGGKCFRVGLNRKQAGVNATLDSFIMQTFTAGSPF